MSKIISFRLLDPDFDKIAAKIGGSDQVNAFCKQMAEQYDRKTITFTPESERVKAEYEAKIEVLEKLLDEQSEKIILLNQDKALSGIEQRNFAVSEEVERKMNEIRQSELKENHEKLVKDHSELGKEYDKVVDELEGLHKRMAMTTQIVEHAPALLMGLKTIMPGLVQKLEGALGNLVAGGNQANAEVIEMSNEDKQKIEFYTEFYNAFPGDKFEKMMQIVQFCIQEPEGLEHFNQQISTAQ